MNWVRNNAGLYTETEGRFRIQYQRKNTKHWTLYDARRNHAIPHEDPVFPKVDSFKTLKDARSSASELISNCDKCNGICKDGGAIEEMFRFSRELN